MIISENIQPNSPAIRPNIFHVIVGACFVISLVLLLWILPQVFLGFTILSLPILIFDAIFVFLIFPLYGQLFNKIFLAGVCNAVGLVWEYLLGCVAANGWHYFGEVFGIFYFVVSPFLQLLWIISMWAFVLSVLASNVPRGVDS